jgi:hypothetical protein
MEVIGNDQNTIKILEILQTDLGIDHDTHLMQQIISQIQLEIFYVAPLDSELIQPKEQQRSDGKVPVTIIEPLKDDEVE